jgi:cation diffusion facilitator family transporter
MNTTTDGQAAAQKRRIAAYSVGVGVILTSLKLTVGLLTGSLGILSEALHSLLDLGAALITFFSVRISTRPPDREHPYGHGKMENISALAEALLLLITCIWIVYEAVQRLFVHSVPVEVTIWSFLVMGVSLGLDIFISRLLSAGARRYRSQALEADGLHYSSDILSSAVVIIGLVGVRLGVPTLDPIAALGVAVLVTIASLRLGYRAVRELLDEAPRGLSEGIRKAILAMHEVDELSTLRVRRSGSALFVDMIVSAHRHLSLDQGHELADRIEKTVKDIAPESNVLVHLHPSTNGESLLETAQVVAERFPPIQGVHNLASYQDVRNGRYFLSLHVKLDPNLPLVEAHTLMDNFENALRQELPEVGEVETHMETAEEMSNGERVRLTQSQLEEIRQQVLADPRVLSLHSVSLHQIPRGPMVTCHLMIEGSLPLEQAHALATSVEGTIKRILPGVTEVLVHTEPATGSSARESG